LKKPKTSDSYIARLTGTKPDQPCFTIIGSGSWSAIVNGTAVLIRPSIERANGQLDPQQHTPHDTRPSHQAFTPQAFIRWGHQSGHPIAAYYSFMDPERMKGW